MTQAYHIMNFIISVLLHFHHIIFCRRELLPDGILYASKDSHYSVFKAARMYRMDSETINTSVNGEMDYSDLRAKLLQNKDKPAIINVTIGIYLYSNLFIILHFFFYVIKSVILSLFH